MINIALGVGVFEYEHFSEFNAIFKASQVDYIEWVMRGLDAIYFIPTDYVFNAIHVKRGKDGEVVWNESTVEMAKRNLNMIYGNWVKKDGEVEFLLNSVGYRSMEPYPGNIHPLINRKAEFIFHTSDYGTVDEKICLRRPAVQSIMDDRQSMSRNQWEKYLCNTFTYEHIHAK